MHQVIENKTQSTNRFKIVNVAEFCRKFRLNPKEERRLKLLFGQSAGEHELLMHATREPRFR